MRGNLAPLQEMLWFWLMNLFDRDVFQISRSKMYTSDPQPSAYVPSTIKCIIRLPTSDGRSNMNKRGYMIIPLLHICYVKSYRMQAAGAGSSYVFTAAYLTAAWTWVSALEISLDRFHTIQSAPAKWRLLLWAGKGRSFWSQIEIKDNQWRRCRVLENWVCVTAELPEYRDLVSRLESLSNR